MFNMEQDNSDALIFFVTLGVLATVCILMIGLTS